MARAWAGGGIVAGGAPQPAGGSLLSPHICADEDCCRLRAAKEPWQRCHIYRRTETEKRLGVKPGDHILMHGAFSDKLAGAAIFSHDAIAIGNDAVVEYGGGVGIAGAVSPASLRMRSTMYVCANVFPFLSDKDHRCGITDDPGVHPAEL